MNAHPEVSGTSTATLLVRLRALVAAMEASTNVPPPGPCVSASLGADRVLTSDEAFLTCLYRELLDREPDPWGFKLHLGNLRRGTSREFVRQAFLNSEEYRARKNRLAQAVPSPEAPPMPMGTANPPGTRPLRPAPGDVAAPAPGEIPGSRPLRPDEYPKANPVGAHGIPNYLQDMADVDFVLDRLSRVGARNTLLIVPFPDPGDLREVDRAFIRGARQRGITVQFRLGWNFAGPDAAMKPPLMGVAPDALRRYTAQIAAELGSGPYIQIGNEPNLAHEWADGRIDAERFARWWIRYADSVSSGGGYPGLPGMAAGAWDVPDGSARNEFGFYREVLEEIMRQSPGSLDRAWFGAHPYHMYADAGHPDFVEDLWWQLREYDRIHRETTGRSLPILVTESGYVDGPNARRFDPDSSSQAEDVARFKRSLRDRPDWLVVGTADWLISNRHGTGQWHGIYGPDGERTSWARVLEEGKSDWMTLEDTVRS